MSVDYSIIHKHLKQLKFVQGTSGVSGPNNAQLDEQTSIKYISSLCHNLTNLNDTISSDSFQISSTTLNEIIVLTRTLDHVPKSDTIFTLFDTQLFRTLFNLMCLSNIPIEVLRGILRISLTYLAGVLPKTRKQGMFRVLLNVLCEPVDDNNGSLLRCDVLFANLTSRITLTDARMNLNIVDFVAKVLYRLMETIGSVNNESNSLLLEEQWLLSVVRSLYVNNFFGALSSIKGIGEIEGMTGLRGSMELTEKYLDSKKFDSNISVWSEYCALTKEVGILLNKNDLSALINHGKTIDILSLLGIIGALKQQKKTLKKTLIECNMTSAFPILQFMSIISDSISNKQKSLNKIFGVWNTCLWFCLLNVSTNCWLFSRASSKVVGDTEKIVDMVNVVLEWLANQLQSLDSSTSEMNIENRTTSDYDVALLLDKVNNFDYTEIKLLQLKAVNENHYKHWKMELKPFEELIHNQVVALVRDQRFLQLSKGSWVHASNPLESGDNNHFYFLTLNSNSQSIVYKEFSKRPTKSVQAPNLDKDGIYIEFRNIVAIESENLNQNISNTGLINIQSERMDVNRIEIITKTNIFSFYVNTRQLKDIWVDGLRILVADSKSDVNTNSNAIAEPSSMQLSVSEKFFSKSGVSDVVKKQIRVLEEIRVRTQMLDLNDRLSITASENIKVEAIDWSTLSLDFNYD